MYWVEISIHNGTKHALCSQQNNQIICVGNAMETNVYFVTYAVISQFCSFSTEKLHTLAYTCMMWLIQFDSSSYMMLAEGINDLWLNNATNFPVFSIANCKNWLNSKHYENALISCEIGFSEFNTNKKMRIETTLYHVDIKYGVSLFSEATNNMPDIANDMSFKSQKNFFFSFWIFFFFGFHIHQIE